MPTGRFYTQRCYRCDKPRIECRCPVLLPVGERTLRTTVNHSRRELEMALHKAQEMTKAVLKHNEELLRRDTARFSPFNPHAEAESPTVEAVPTYACMCTTTDAQGFVISCEHYSTDPTGKHIGSHSGHDRAGNLHRWW